MKGGDADAEEEAEGQGQTAPVAFWLLWSHHSLKAETKRHAHRCGDCSVGWWLHKRQASLYRFHLDRELKGQLHSLGSIVLRYHKRPTVGMGFKEEPKGEQTGSRSRVTGSPRLWELADLLGPAPLQGMSAFDWLEDRL